MSPEVQKRGKSDLMKSTDALQNRVKTTVMILPFKFARAVADPRGRPLYGPNFSQFHAVFFGKFGKILCWRPLLRGTLDPPL